MQSEIFEKNKYRGTDSNPVIYILNINCEGTIEEINTFQKKLDKFINNGMKTNMRTTTA